jgi:hypothetical protein
MVILLLRDFVQFIHYYQNVYFLFVCYFIFFIVAEAKDAFVLQKGLELIKLCILQYMEQDRNLLQVLFLIIKGFAQHGLFEV